MWFISKNFGYFKHSLFPTTSLVPYKFEITEINCSVLKKGKSAVAISSLFNGSESSVSSVSFENSILDKSSILFRIYLNLRNIFLFFFFYQGFLHRHWQFTGQQGKGGDHLLFTLPLPPAHEHSDIYLQLCMWDDYHVFLIATLVFTRLLLDEICHFIELPFE